jgi:hypothetical protein
MNIENEVPENEARKVLEKKYRDIVDQTGKINTEIIENNIRKILDDFHLGISNYYRLRRYFIDEYRRWLPKKEQAAA